MLSWQDVLRAAQETVEDGKIVYVDHYDNPVHGSFRIVGDTDRKDYDADN